MTFLIVGCDSKIGKAIFNYFNKLNYNLLLTTRNRHAKENIFLDLLDPDYAQIPTGPGTALISLGLTNIKDINSKLDHSYFINVTQTLELINVLIQKKWDIIYFSSDAVIQLEKFGIYRVPKFYRNYALQKYLVESVLLAQSNSRVKIVRLSKVIFEDLDLVRRIAALSPSGLRKNHFLSPISITHLIFSLQEILQAENQLNLICGDTYTSYFDFANFLQTHIGLNSTEFFGINAEEDEVFHFIDLKSLKEIQIISESRSELISFITKNKNIFSNH